MSEPKQRGRLTLSALQAIEVPDATRARADAPSEPSRTPPAGVETVPDTAPAFRVEAREHLPEGVSREVASILGMPSRDELERAAATRAAAEKAAAEAAERARREAELADERRRAAEAAEHAQREIRATQAAAAVQVLEARKRTRASAVVALVALLGLGAIAAFVLARPPELDATPYAAVAPAPVPQAHAEGTVGFMAIPPAPIIEAPPEDATGRSRSGGRSGRPSVRGTELF